MVRGYLVLPGYLDVHGGCMPGHAQCSLVAYSYSVYTLTILGTRDLVDMSWHLWLTLTKRGLLLMYNTTNLYQETIIYYPTHHNVRY